MSQWKTTLVLAVIVTSTTTLAPRDAWADEVGDFISATISRGDANDDGRVDENDAKVLQNLLMGRCARAVPLRALDIDENGVFDAADVDALRDSLDLLPEGIRDAEEEEVRVMLGDANDDGSVDERDLISIAFHALLGRIVESPLVAADVDGNGVVDFEDLSRLAAVVYAASPAS